MRNPIFRNSVMSSLFFLRLAVAVIFIFHAVPKLKNPKAMASSMGWSSGQVLGLGIVEFVSALSIVGGVGTRFSALALMVIMLGAIYHKMKKWNVPFSSQSSTGWEFDLILFAANLTIYLKY